MEAESHVARLASNLVYNLRWSWTLDPLLAWVPDIHHDAKLIRCWEWDPGFYACGASTLPPSPAQDTGFQLNVSESFQKT